MAPVGLGLVAVHLVSFLVAFRAESQEIVRDVVAEAAPCLHMMDLKILRCAAGLAPPAVTLKH